MSAIVDTYMCNNHEIRAKWENVNQEFIKLRFRSDYGILEKSDFLVMAPSTRGKFILHCQVPAVKTQPDIGALD